MVIHLPIRKLINLHFTISDRFVSSKRYDKRDDFDFDLVNFLLSE